jgi:hypothetical protein
MINVEYRHTSFNLYITNFGPPIKLFALYAFLSLGDPDAPARNPGVPRGTQFEKHWTKVMTT